jgi:hypothetical protein
VPVARELAFHLAFAVADEEAGAMLLQGRGVGGNIVLVALGIGDLDVRDQ